MTVHSLAKEMHTESGVNAGDVLHRFAIAPIALDCRQGDDVGGLETSGGEPGNGLPATGNYPRKGRSIDELRADWKQTFARIPNTHRLILANCADRRHGRVDRNALDTNHFRTEPIRSNHEINRPFPDLWPNPLAYSGALPEKQTSGNRDQSLRS